MKKRKHPVVKVRRVWKIHPRTRVKPSGKLYRRSSTKKELHRALEGTQESEDLI
ncbi:MAG: hypothetical protein HYZ90_06465 [Candidatus Omnitrophica bacterium]|nr:hypothetical protein [Candidatus Omnitrophota bacterium]